jgi:HAD superfamily hydrolase (TIGR01490 family)
MGASHKLVVFDLDHTLLDGDSDALWCDFLIAKGMLDAADFGPRNAAMVRDYQAGTVSVRAFCDFYVSTLAGRTPAQWEPLRQAFLREAIAPRLGSASRALVRQHQGEGALVVLSTATNRFITELTAQDLGIGHLIATDCEVAADGHFTGQVQGLPNMRQGKVTRLRAWLAARGRTLVDFDSWAYSDSINDLPLLLATNHAVAVNPDVRLAAVATERGWPVLHLRA